MDGIGCRDPVTAMLLLSITVLNLRENAIQVDAALLGVAVILPVIVLTRTMSIP